MRAFVAAFAAATAVAFTACAAALAGFRARVLTASSVVGFDLSPSASGQGLAAWVDGQCSTGGAAVEYGPVFASVVRDGTFDAPAALTPSDAQDYAGNVVAAPDCGGTVTWGSLAAPGTQASFPGGFVVQIVDVGADGRPGPAQLVTSDPPLIADGGGDVIHDPGSLLTGATLAFLSPAGGGADQALPVPAHENGLVGLATAPIGRAAVAAWNPDFDHDPPQTMAVSVWRP